MTTPNDITDLMKALDRNPELDAALPQRLLTQDLLELPNNVAQLTDAVAEMTRVFDQRLTALDSRFDTAHAGIHPWDDAPSLQNHGLHCARRDSPYPGRCSLDRPRSPPHKQLTGVPSSLGRRRGIRHLGFDERRRFPMRLPRECEADYPT